MKQIHNLNKYTNNFAWYKCLYYSYVLKKLCLKQKNSDDKMETGIKQTSTAKTAVPESLNTT